MPVRMPEGLKRLSDIHFTQAAYEVMEVVFAVHRQFGRLFDEAGYVKEIARRLNNARTGAMLELSFKSFRKPLYLHRLYDNGAVFEFTATEALVDRCKVPSGLCLSAIFLPSSFPA